MLDIFNIPERNRTWIQFQNEDGSWGEPQIHNMNIKDVPLIPGVQEGIAFRCKSVE